MTASGGICVRKSDAAYIRVFTAKGSCSVVPDQQPQIRSLSIVASGVENYRQELIYRGKSGSTLDFVYREMRDDQPFPILALDFHIEPTKPGFLKLFAQVRVDGRDIFLPFGVDVAGPDTAAAPAAMQH